VTVVMGLQQGCPPPCFVGSDTSASAAHSTDTSDETGKVVPVVQCVARGSFGTYLAVAVASVTVAAPSDGTTKDEGGMPAGDTSDGAAGCGGASTTCSSGGSADSAAGVQLSVTQALGDDDDRCPTNWPTHIAITVGGEMRLQQPSTTCGLLALLGICSPISCTAFGHVGDLTCLWQQHQAV
jgi:hypothetical protein